MRVMVIANEFPLLSETFVLEQIIGLIQSGCDVATFFAGSPPEARTHSEVEAYQLLKPDLLQSVFVSASVRSSAGIGTICCQGPLPGTVRLRFRPVAARPPGFRFRSPFRMLSLAANLDEMAPFDVVLCYFGPKEYRVNRKTTSHMVGFVLGEYVIEV